MGQSGARRGPLAECARLPITALMPVEAPETIFVDSHRVACDGGGALGHPLVYLELGEEGRVMCPYCSRVFVKAQAPVETETEARPE
jgi:uncharacterized Zn-finger protein